MMMIRFLFESDLRYAQASLVCGLCFYFWTVAVRDPGSGKLLLIVYGISFFRFFGLNGR
jgi:hypothetical protein